jgi:basic membrane lipoprotein Med (substrate-binding protein (PBP1-ABC) superfamily)
MWGNGVEKKAPNVGIYYGRMYGAKFLVGMVAGARPRQTKSATPLAFQYLT